MHSPPEKPPSDEEFARDIYDKTLRDEEWDDTRKKIAIMFLNEIKKHWPIHIRYLDRIKRNSDGTPGDIVPGQVDGETWCDREKLHLRYFRWEGGMEAAVLDFKWPWSRTKHCLRVSHQFVIKFLADMQLINVPKGDRLYVVADPQFPIVLKGPGIAHDLDPNHFTIFMELRMAFPDAPQESDLQQAQDQANSVAKLVDKNGRPL